MFVHNLPQPERLGITWLLHCGFLAACAKDMAASRLHLIVAMNTQAWWRRFHVRMIAGVHVLLSVCTKDCSG